MYNRINKRYVKPSFAVLFAALIFCSFTFAASASAPYYTRIFNRFDNLPHITKDGYLPVRTLDVFGELELKNPSGIVCVKNAVYIADTGNGRIIKTNKDGELLAVIGEGILQQPKGIFVTENGNIYAADDKLKSVVLFNPDGEVIQEYTRPQNALFGTTATYNPTKVAADNAGNVYIISDGNFNGIIQLSREGDFFGYVGANNTPLAISDVIQRMFFTDEQKAQLKVNVPVTPNNLYIDKRGLIYTVTQGGASDALKKLNIAGVNMLTEVSVDELVTAVCVGEIGNIYTVSTDGYIAEYTEDGDFLFLFGGRDDGYNRDGLFMMASGIAVDSDYNLYVLDYERKSVTVFSSTDYAETIHTALAFHESGDYQSSLEPWEYTLKQDAMFERAYRGLGYSYYKTERFDEALDAFRIGNDKARYSDVYWEIRNEWLLANLPFVLGIIITLIVIVKILKALDRKKAILAPLHRVSEKINNYTLIKQFAHLKYVPKNPADVFYGIKHEKKTSIFTSTLIYLIFFILYMLDKYLTGFLFKSVPDGKYEIGTDILTVFGVITLFIICHNLICSIRDGEGKMRFVYCGFAHCLMPYIFLKPAVILLSYGLTYNESVIIGILNFIIYTGMAVLVVIMIKEIQSYTFSKTFTSILLTAFTMAMAAVTIIIIIALVGQVFDFVSSIAREVMFRAYQ